MNGRFLSQKVKGFGGTTPEKSEDFKCHRLQFNALENDHFAILPLNSWDEKSNEVKSRYLPEKANSLQVESSV